IMSKLRGPPLSRSSLGNPSDACYCSGSPVQRARSRTPSFHPQVPVFLQRVVVGLAGADAHGAIEVVDKDFPVANLAGLGGVADRGHDLVFDAVLDADLDLQLRQE